MSCHVQPAAPHATPSRCSPHPAGSGSQRHTLLLLFPALLLLAVLLLSPVLLLPGATLLLPVDALVDVPVDVLLAGAAEVPADSDDDDTVLLLWATLVAGALLDRDATLLDADGAALALAEDPAEAALEVPLERLAALVPAGVEVLPAVLELSGETPLLPALPELPVPPARQVPSTHSAPVQQSSDVAQALEGTSAVQAHTPAREAQARNAARREGVMARILDSV